MPDNKLCPPKRLLHLDLLRLTAILFVIFNHTSDRGYFLFADSVGSWLYFPYMASSVLCKVAVPIFFMISGALLLPKEESLSKLFSKRILRMVVVLVLISVPYYLWLHRAEGLSLSSFLTYIYGNSASTSLWYLYSYVALLLMMPFLRAMVKGMEEKDFRYLIAGYILVFGVLPCLEFCLWKDSVIIHESFNPVLFMTPNVFYALAGYYLEHVTDHQKNRRRRIGRGIGLTAVALAVTCFMTHYQMTILGECTADQLERFFNCFIYIPAMTLYLFMKYASEKVRSVRLRKLLPVLGGTVFGIYLIEKFCRALTNPVYVVAAPIAGSFIASLCWGFATFCLSFVIVVALKHTPVIKKLVNRFI